jgi:hypothetical protein
MSNSEKPAHQPCSQQDLLHSFEEEVVVLESPVKSGFSAMGGLTGL